MATLSIKATRLMHKHFSKACTDITGFGLLGHASYLAQAQKNSVKFVINKFPIYKNAIKL